MANSAQRMGDREMTQANQTSHRILITCPNPKCGKINSFIDPRVVDYRLDYGVCQCGEKITLEIANAGEVNSGG